MLNYEVEPSALKAFLPVGTELDVWKGRTLVSVVGFLFLGTRLMGVPIPFHQDFEEVNLRFYVRRKAEDGWRRGVVFIREIVPRRLIAIVARKLYNEPYIALPMTHCFEGQSGLLKSVEYGWRFKNQKNSIKVLTREPARDLEAGSEAEFITEHYWGYNIQRNGAALEYRVDHPRWRVYETVEARLDCDVSNLYGAQFSASLRQKPTSAFLAEGSAVTVYRGVRVST